MRGLLVAAVLSLHLAVLLPIALSPPREPPPAPVDPVFLVPLDLTETLTRRTSVRRPARDAPESPRRPTARRARLQGPAAGSAPPVSQIAEAAPIAAEPVLGDTAQAAPDPWHGRGPPPMGRLPCPPPAGDRIAARLCLVGPPPAREDDPYDDAGRRRLDRTEQAREDSFERQRQANEAWRDYTRGEGAYPGLRSLFRDR